MIESYFSDVRTEEYKRTTAPKSQLLVVNHVVRAINREKEKLFPKIDMTEPNYKINLSAVEGNY